MTATPWRKSSRSGNSGANCVEVRVVTENSQKYEVRDSKLGDASPIFGFTTEDYRSLLHAAR